MKISILRRREFWLKCLSVMGYLYGSNDKDDGVLSPSAHCCKTTLTEI